MRPHDKILYFDYFISRVIFWKFNDGKSNSNYIITNNIDRCDLNEIKLFKLLFLSSSLEVDGLCLLDDVFNNFYAAPYGPVEKDVSDNISALVNYIVENRTVKIKDTADFSYPSESNDPIYSRIDKYIHE